jgi:hypothetical protein
MAQTRVRLLHRMVVDWVADTFGLRTPDARTRHENARFRAEARTAAWHARARAGALPARLHARRGEPRILKGWQARIGRKLGQHEDQAGQNEGQA